MTGLLTLPGTPASAGQHQNGNRYANFAYNNGAGGFWNVDQELRVDRKAPASYWAQLWQWTGASQGGYLGLQTDGGRFDGSHGDTAIFSLWNATAASGPSCGTFGGEGTGYSCRLDYPIQTGRWYRLRVWRLNNDAQGQWWGAWILDEQTGDDRWVGNLRVARNNTLIQGTRNFSEYFGTQVACNQVPTSIVQFTQPAANSRGAGSYDYGSHYASSSAGGCGGGSVTPMQYGSKATAGARIILGGS